MSNGSNCDQKSQLSGILTVRVPQKKLSEGTILI